MPKMKSVKAAVKRFRIKKNGSIKRGSAFRRHILTKQDAATRREQNRAKLVHPTNIAAIKEMIK